MSDLLKHLVFAAVCYMGLSFILNDMLWIACLYDGEDDWGQRALFLVFWVFLALNVFINRNMAKNKANQP